MKKTYIIAEAGVNHNGSVELAKKLVDAAVSAGADAVKFQIFKAEKLLCAGTPKTEYQSAITGEHESQMEMLKQFELGEASYLEIYRCCLQSGIDFLSTPFDSESLNFLINKINLPVIKISSCDITNAPFLVEIARSKKRVILSTGMSTLAEVESALGYLAFGYLNIEGRPDLRKFSKIYDSAGKEILRASTTLLHCTTEYPAPYSDVNLRAIDTLRDRFNLPVGFSDHTLGIAVSIAAAARGASVLEKHLTLDRKMSGPDHQSSVEPDEFKMMVESVRQVEEALGDGVKVPLPSENKNINVIRRSLVAGVKIKKGEEFTEKNLALKRAEKGLSPEYYWDYLGRKAERDYEPDEPVV